MKHFLFTNYFQSSSPERMAEYEFCIEKNKVAGFDRIYLFVENEEDYKAAERHGTEVVNIGKRPTFKDFFDFINTEEFADSVNIVANTDIFILNMQQIDGNLHRLVRGSSCFALTRYDYHHHRPSYLYDTPDSQDTWVFNGNERLDAVQNVDFTMGTAGCLSGNTELVYKRGSTNKKIKLSLIYKKFNQIKTNRGKKFNPNIITNIQSINTETSEVFYNQIVSITESGIKKTIKIHFQDQTAISVTNDHKILSENFIYKEAGHLKIGDKIVAKGDMKPIKSDRKKHYPERKVIYVKYHPFAEIKKIRGWTYKRVRRYRLVYEANMNNMTLESFVDILNNNPSKSKELIYLDSKIEVHHKDGNTTNDIIENLEIMNKREHAQVHGNDRGFIRTHTILKEIIKIEDAEEEMTYDISMMPPHNNFLANGVFVHNCDNKLAYELSQAGFEVLNPSRTIVTFHLHDVNIRTYVSENIYRIPPPYKLLPPEF